MAALLAVDLGVRTGLACVGEDGRVRWYRSRNFGNAARLRRAIPAVLREIPDLVRLVVEGGGPLLKPWVDEGERHGLVVRTIGAEAWRAPFLYAREQRTGAEAKRVADRLARRVIEWSDAPRPTSLRHDAAEAVMIGVWGALEAGWLRELPEPLRR